jgi:hypothetical protein
VNVLMEIVAAVSIRIRRMGIPGLDMGLGGLTLNPNRVWGVVREQAPLQNTISGEDTSQWITSFLQTRASRVL